MSKFRDFEKYEVFEDGRIYSYCTKKFLKPHTNQYGYQRVYLYNNEGNGKLYMVHRVVWEAVTGEPIPKGYEINHIDENKDNNSKSNLELTSHKQNINWGSRNTRIAKSLSKQVGAFKDGKLVMTFQSAMEAGRNGFNFCNISECCNGKRKTHKGYSWRYL